MGAGARLGLGDRWAWGMRLGVWRGREGVAEAEEGGGATIWLAGRAEFGVKSIWFALAVQLVVWFCLRGKLGEQFVWLAGRLATAESGCLDDWL